MEDNIAWQQYPQHRNFFNKLWLSNELGYDCGPCGVAPSHDGYYIVRPIYNLSGMGAGARKVYIKAGDTSSVPPGYFWCEWFEGIHYSATYGPFIHNTKGEWTKKHCFIGKNQDNALTFFQKWYKINYVPTLSRFFHLLSDVPIINVEFIGDKPIEVHLRESPDPMADEVIPIWDGDQHKIKILENKGYTYVESYDDADGFIEIPRIGFMMRNKTYE
jgi:hypothetical protein